MEYSSLPFIGKVLTIRHHPWPHQTNLSTTKCKAQERVFISTLHWRKASIVLVVKGVDHRLYSTNLSKFPTTSLTKNPYLLPRNDDLFDQLQGSKRTLGNWVKDKMSPTKGLGVRYSQNYTQNTPWTLRISNNVIWSDQRTRSFHGPNEPSMQTLLM